MTQVCAICISLLKGETHSIMSAFKAFYVSNLPREIGRSVERKFGVKVHRTPVKFKSTYGHTGEYYRYTLLNTSENKIGRKRMIEYCKKQLANPKTTQELKIQKQLSLL